MIKALVIDSVVWAKYEIKDTTLFLKILLKDYPIKPQFMEDLIISIIQVQQKTVFNFVGHLNI